MSTPLIVACKRLAVSTLTAAAFIGAMPAHAVTATTALVIPATLIVASGLPKGQANAQILAARRYATFWSTGDEALARAALSPQFMDRTLPPGRPQGIAGPLAAAIAFRAAVPDINCAVVQMIVTGDRVVAHLRFTGHFTGLFQGVQGHGQNVDFIATDIYRIEKGRIAENWHLEDNLTFLQQIGLIPQ